MTNRTLILFFFTMHQLLLLLRLSINFTTTFRTIFDTIASLAVDSLLYFLLLPITIMIVVVGLMMEGGTTSQTAIEAKSTLAVVIVAFKSGDDSWVS